MFFVLDRSLSSLVRRLGVAGVAVGLAGVLVGCGGGGGGSSDSAPSTTATGKVPAGCSDLPYEIEVGVGADPASPFEVADAAARRVSILPGKMAFDASEMAGLTSQASVSPLGAYTMFLTDGSVPDDQLSGSGPAEIYDGSSTVVAVQILPAAEGGFTEGEVVAATTTLGYETRSETPPLSAFIAAEGTDAQAELTSEVTGTATVLQVDDESICVDLDLTIAGDSGGSIAGTARAPVVRSGDSYFVT